MRKGRLLARLRRAFRGGSEFLINNNLELSPLARSLKGYNEKSLFADAKAGLNVALLALPQGMAYAVIAGLPVKYGLYCSAVAAIAASFLSSSRHTILGPTNATAFMLFSSYPLALSKEETLPLLVFMVGLFLVLGAYVKIAELIQYVSRSVVVGYITGAAILIIVNQMHNVLGYSLEEVAAGDGEGSGRTLFSILSLTIRGLSSVQWPAVALGAGSILLYFVLVRRFRPLPNFAITLLVMSLLAAGMKRFGWEVEMFSALPFGWKIERLPEFDFDSFSTLAGLAFAVAFLASLENSVMSKTLASRTGDQPNVNQDMLSVGFTNLACSFLGGMPASGSLTRSALNYASGARTQMSSLICGCICVLAALIIGPLIQFIPKPSLAALVICIAASLINPGHIRICMSATGSDATVLLVTFFGALIAPLNVAIFLGVWTSVTLYLRKASKPELVEYELNDEGALREASISGKRKNPAISIVHVEGELFFGAAELFRSQIQRTCEDENLKIIILRMRNARHLDATSVMALEDLLDFLRKNDRHLLISGIRKNVYSVLRNSRLIGKFGRENIFLDTTANPNISTRNALKRAQQLLGTQKADIQIYHDPRKPREG